MRTLSLLLIFALTLALSNCLLSTINTFNVTKIQKSTPAECNKEKGEYHFQIIGTFEEEPLKANNTEVDLEFPENGKATCIPELGLQEGNAGQFECCIKVLTYPVDGGKITLTKTKPTSEIYDFFNWEEFMANDNQVVEKASCQAEATYVFTPKKVENDKEKKIFKMTGEWNKESTLYSISEFELNLSNEKTAKCNFDQTTPKEISCNYDGEDDIKIKEKLFYGEDGLVYKIEKYEPKSNSKSSYISLSMFALLSILLF